MSDNKEPNTKESVSSSVLIEGILAVEDLINETYGIIGLHLNGDDAPWDELRTGGRFEEWLLKFDEALLIAKSMRAKAGE